MVNLLGEAGHEGGAQYQGLDKALALEGIKVHLYGKKMTKPFRKMGHITIIAPDAAQLKDKVQQVQPLVKVIA